MFPPEAPPTIGSPPTPEVTTQGGGSGARLEAGGGEIEQRHEPPLRVLVIDDSETDVELLEHEFLRGGFRADLTRVDEPASLKAALEDRKWDLILCDWIMPRLSALDALDIVQAHSVYLPVIILSGRVDEGAAVIALKRGAHDFIPKQNQTRLIPAVHRELHEARERERRHAAEIALRESEQQFRELAENISEVFWITDLSGTEMIYINPAYEQVWGQSREKLEKHPAAWVEAVHPDDRERIAQAFQRNAAKHRYDLEYRLIMPDGSIRWIWNRSVPILDAEGHPYRIAGVAEDITSRKRLEEDYRSVIQHSQEGLALVRDGRLVFTNPALCEILGYSNEELGEINWDQFPEMVHEDDRARFTTAFVRFIMDPDNSSTCGEFRLVRPDGTVRQVETDFCHARYDGQPAFQLAVLDVTDRHNTEAALRRFNEELELRVRDRTELLEKTVSNLDSFTQSVSHDLRAPLRAIRGFSTILLEDYQGSLDERGRDYLLRACKGAEHMENLVEGLLELSRLTKGEVHLEEIDLSAEASAIAAELETLHPERKVTCRVQSGVLARADHTLIHDAIRNLFNNAWKFTAREERAELEFGSKVVSGDRIYWVADNGIGFDPTQAEHLFTMYRRLSSGDEFEGDGIGLAVVDRIITRHGGRVWAEGKPGRGATIFFTLGENNREPSTDTERSAAKTGADRNVPQDTGPAS